MEAQLGRQAFNSSHLRLGFFGFVFASQIGHLSEHILVRLTGSAVLGAAANSEETHLVFNGLVALWSLVLVWSFRRNGWVYLLAILAVLHGIEHAYIYEQYLRTGITDGPGLLGFGGAIGLIPLARVDLHNIYNGFELILIALGFQSEIDATLSREEEIT